MKQFFYNMSGAFRTAAAFLLIFSCMVTTSVVSVRAEEQMEAQLAGNIGVDVMQQEMNGIQRQQTGQENGVQGNAAQKEDAEGGAGNGTVNGGNINDGNTNGESSGHGTTGSGPTGEGTVQGNGGQENQTSGGQTGSSQGTKDAGIEENGNSAGQADGTDADAEEESRESPEAPPIGRRYLCGDYGTAYVVGAQSRMMRSAVNSDCRITPGTQHSYGSWVTNEFYVVTDEGNYMGYCAQPNKPTPSGIYRISQLNNDRIKMALMFGADGPWAKEASELCGGTANPYPYIHAMIGIEYTGDTNGLSSEQILGIRNALDEQMQKRANMPIFQEYTAYVAYNENQDIVWLEYSGPINGTARLRKSSSNPSLTDGNGCYSLAGAEYGIYVDEPCTQQAGTFTTNEAGESDSVELTAGDYWVKEIRAPRGYRRNETAYPIHVNAGEETPVQVSDVPEYLPAEIQLTKMDSETQDRLPQGNAVFAGTQFTVKYYNGYYEKDSLPPTPARTWVLEAREMADPDGGPSSYRAALDQRHKVSGDDFYMQDQKAVLPLGTVTLEETKAPAGYLLEQAYMKADGSEEKHSGLFISQIREDGKGVSLSGGNQYAVYDQVIRGGVKIQKRDFEIKSALPQGGADLENATFIIVNLNENEVTVNGKSYGRNDQVAVMQTDENGVAQTENNLLPYGKYRIIETGAPTGYLEEGLLCQEFSITENGKVVDLTDTEHSIQNQVKRGDFELRKIDAETQDVMQGVQFKVTSVNTGESHMITTDENGYYCSESAWNKHSRNTNQGGKEDGLWFGTDQEGNPAPVNDKKGALPYDTYTLEEIPSGANEGKIMLNTTFVIYRDRVTIDLGNLENKEPDEGKPAISTSAGNEATGDHYGAAEGRVTIVDSVIYSGLKEKEEYLLKCMPMNRSDGKAITDKNGNPIVSEQVFTASASAGIVEVECTFDASGLGGFDVVIYEELYCRGRKIAEHRDLKDERQTIHFPKIGTKAMDKASGTNTAVAGEEVTIVDTVSYENLKAGQEYTLIGKLMDKETQKAVKDADGRDVVSEVKFVPKEKNGKAEVLFTFDGSMLEGKTLVAFERLEKNGKLYAVHADISDENQTIYFPKIRTAARDVRTDSRNANAADETVVVDSVFYTNLTSGQEYTVEGILMDKKTQEPLLQDGKEITAETTFTPEEESGTVDVTFKFDASALAGKTAVAYESVTQDGEEVAAHKDIDYEEQTIHFPEIGTKAREKESGSREVTVPQKKEMTIVDEVAYKNLIPGEEYTIKGSLMDKATGKAFLDGEKEVTAEKTFIPEEADGTVEMEFTFQAEPFKKMEIVLFEKVFLSGAEVAAHEEIDDEGQTIRVSVPGMEEPAAGPGKSVKTGDRVQILPAVFLMLLSLAALITAARRKIG